MQQLLPALVIGKQEAEKALSPWKETAEIPQVRVSVSRERQTFIVISNFKLLPAVSRRLGNSQAAAAATAAAAFAVAAAAEGLCLECLRYNYYLAGVARLARAAWGPLLSVFWP